MARIEPAITGMASGYGNGENGVGHTSTNFRDATRVGKFPNDNTGPNRSRGETPGVGSIYSAVLNEWPNASHDAIRNSGPSRDPSRSGSTAIPMVSMASRNTGRVGG